MNKTDIKKLYDLLHEANTSAERDKIMRNAIQFSPEYEKTVLENLIRNINDAFTAFTTDRDCYKQFKDILYSFQDSKDDSGKPVQFKIKIKTGSRSRSKGKGTTPPAMALKSPSKDVLPIPLQPSPQNSVSNLSDLKIGIFVTAFLTCDASQRAPFVKRYIHAMRPNGDSFPEFVDDILSDMNHIRRRHYLSEVEMRNQLIDHLKHMNEGSERNIFIVYPLPQIHMNMMHKIRGRPSNRHLGGGRGRAKGRKTRRFK
jgi:hypothetical protein